MPKTLCQLQVQIPEVVDYPGLTTLVSTPVMPTKITINFFIELGQEIRKCYGLQC